jgi:hypothetical protein
MPVTASAGRLPCDDLRCHLVLRVAKVPCEAKISEFELAICGNEQVIGFEILKPALKRPEPGGL